MNWLTRHRDAIYIWIYFALGFVALWFGAEWTSGLLFGMAISLVLAWAVNSRDHAQRELNEKGYHRVDGRLYRIVPLMEVNDDTDNTF